MFGASARVMYRRRWYVLGSWMVVLVLAGALASQVGSLLGAPDYTFSGSDSARAAAVLDRTFHQNGLKTTLVVLTNPRLQISDPAFQRATASVVSRLRSDARLQVNAIDNPIVSHNTQGVSRDRHSAIITFSTRLAETDMEGQIPRVHALTHVTGFMTAVTGYAALAYEQNQESTKDLSRAEAITIPIMLIILVLAFGALPAAGIPFLIAIVAIVLCMALVWIGAHFMSMSTYVLNIVTFIGLGIAIDYSLFIVNRFREELAATGDSEQAVVRTMQTTGRAIFFSGLAVAVGLSALLITGLPFMQAMGLAGMLIPLCTLVVTLTLLPALLGILGHRVNRFHVLPRRWLQPADGGIWWRVATATMRRPWLYGGAVLVILLAVAVPATRLTLAEGTLQQGQGNTPGVVALDYMRTHFQSAPDPFQIVVQRQGSGTVLDASQLTALTNLERALRRDPEAARVFGLPDVISGPAPSASQVAQAVGHTMSPDRRVGLLTVIPKHDSTTAANMAGLRRIRTVVAGSSLSGSTVLVGGSSATEVDFDATILSRLPLIALFVLGLTYVFLFAAFRTAFLPLKAVALNVLSVGAAFGMLQLVFQEGFGVSLLGGTQTDGVPTWVLLFLFAFLFGLSMDYEVLLLSRIREGWLQTGDNEASVVHGVERTGRLISSAALIMALAFSGFILGMSVWMKEMGLGLTVSIVVDATLIRIVLVPAIMKLMGQWNWWVPSRMRAWSRRGGVEHDDPRPATGTPVTVERVPSTLKG